MRFLMNQLLFGVNNREYQKYLLYDNFSNVWLFIRYCISTERAKLFKAIPTH